MKKGFVEGIFLAMDEVCDEFAKSAKIRHKFIPNKWMIFDLQNGDTAIGCTQMRDSQPVIVYASDAGVSGVLHYARVVNPRRLFVESRENNNIRQSVMTLPDVYINFSKGNA